ncbi:hypothetical protein F4779DRAFT_608394 [Xylariaceae sp. FL0662B]|nr:hypothetical protein F4779DRAFT_608394 [Xylariaceae sp. FL0662B]
MTVNDIGRLTTTESTSPQKDGSAVSNRESADSSLWFVNFPSASAIESPEALRKCMQNVENYHCWVSSKCKGIPERIAQDMRSTMWLGTQSDQRVSKEIQCNINEFHSELINAILAGFVDVGPGFLRTLEKILDSLRRTVAQTTSGSRTSTLIGHRYDYVPGVNVIRPSMRVVSFSVTDSIKHIQTSKSTETEIKCTIEYTEYAALFNESIWELAWPAVQEELLEGIRNKIKSRTVDVMLQKKA